MSDSVVNELDDAQRWLLPDGVQEVLPPESWRLESARRALLDLYWRWGYDLIRPPLIEYLESLLTGAGADLDLQTFKLTDQMTGRMMGVRSDMTTQATRIDAHRLHAQGPARYCYIGSVLRTRAEEPGGSRAPLQIGAEKFGDGDISADLEVVSLMLESLALMGISGVCVDLGHIQVYRRLVAQAELDAELERTVFDVIQRKSRPDLDALHRDARISADLHGRLRTLIELNGDRHTLDTARARLGGIDDGIDAAINTLQTLVDNLSSAYPQMPVFVDFAELRGYRYKTGLLFGAFAPGWGRELARGGRYDQHGDGHARPATGFSADLDVLAALGDTKANRPDLGIHAPYDNDPALWAEIGRQRRAGERVVVASSDSNDCTSRTTCDRIFTHIDGVWQVQRLAD